jgi:hypothetical protein
MIDTSKRMKLKMALRDIIRNMSESDSYDDYEEDDELEDEVMDKGRYSSSMDGCTHLDEPFVNELTKKKKRK